MKCRWFVSAQKEATPPLLLHGSWSKFSGTLGTRSRGPYTVAASNGHSCCVVGHNGLHVLIVLPGAMQLPPKRKQSSGPLGCGNLRNLCRSGGGLPRSAANFDILDSWNGVDEKKNGKLIIYNEMSHVPHLPDGSVPCA